MTPLVDALRAREPDERLAALDRVEDLLAPEPGVGDAVLALLEDSDPELRRRALVAVGHLGHLELERFDERATARIAARGSDDDPRVRAEAAVALALVAEPTSSAAIACLVTLIDDAEALVRREAAAALGDCRAHSAQSVLHKHLQDEDPDTRFECAFALANLGDDAGLEILVAALNGARRRLDALEGMRRLGSPRPIEALEKLAGKFFIGWPERLTVFATLCALGEDGYADKLIERVLKARNRQERALALGLIGSHHVEQGFDVALELARTDGPLQATAVRVLGDLGDRRSQPVLQKIAEENADEELRADALAALDRLG